MSSTAIPRRTDSLRPLIVLGTRPEAIKLSPVILESKSRPGVLPIVCSTGQHREMLDQVLDYFSIQPEIDLDLMQPGQTLAGLTARCLESVDRVIREVQPDCVVVQGDTTTVMASAMAAFYQRVPLVHVEAGLRTGDLYAPWPEGIQSAGRRDCDSVPLCPDRAKSRRLASRRHRAIGRARDRQYGDRRVDARG